MKTFTFATLIAAVAALPAPQDGPTPNPDLTHFQIMSLRSASPIHFQQVKAANSSLFLGLPEQGAHCYSDDGNGPAVFQYNKEEKTLWLYATANPRQQIYVDRSGMGE
jgi:hypothetical protein